MRNGLSASSAAERQPGWGGRRRRLLLRLHPGCSGSRLKLARMMPRTPRAASCVRNEQPHGFSSLNTPALRKPMKPSPWTALLLQSKASAVLPQRSFQPPEKGQRNSETQGEDVDGAARSWALG